MAGSAPRVTSPLGAGVNRETAPEYRGVAPGVAHLDADTSARRARGTPDVGDAETAPERPGVAEDAQARDAGDDAQSVRAPFPSGRQIARARGTPSRTPDSRGRDTCARRSWASSPGVRQLPL